MKPHDVFGSPRGDVLEPFREGRRGHDREGTVGGILRHPVHVDEDPKRIPSIHVRDNGTAVGRASTRHDSFEPQGFRQTGKPSSSNGRVMVGASLRERTAASTHSVPRGGLSELHRTQRFHVGFVRGLVTKFILNLIDLITRVQRKNGQARPRRPTHAGDAHVSGRPHRDFILLLPSTLIGLWESMGQPVSFVPLYNNSTILAKFL